MEDTPTHTIYACNMVVTGARQNDKQIELTGKGAILTKWSARAQCTL